MVRKGIVVYPRGQLDIEFEDLAYGLGQCLSSSGSDTNKILSNHSNTFPCFSVRSGWDLLLQYLNFPVGTEVLVSAVTIPDMIDILEFHGLVPVPIDLHPDTLNLDVSQIKKAVSPNTKMILVAHLFGSRSDMGEVGDLAREHDLLIVEDCAQSYDGKSLRWSDQTDGAMYSFGPIKTATGLGGAVFRVRDTELMNELKEIQSEYSSQSIRSYALRILKYTGLNLLSQPVCFGLFAWLCRLAGSNHDRVISSSTRGFPGGEDMDVFRKTPCKALLRLLERRLQQDHDDTIRQRIQYAEKFIELVPDSRVPGSSSSDHVHWVLPFRSSNPDSLVKKLWKQGYDATRRGSSLVVVPPEDTKPDITPERAREMIENLVYLPMYPPMKMKDLEKLARCVRDHETNGC
ncbi:MAG: DegT/DnrJ/EryC1/StrS family aminotransferase [bacterium]